MKDKRERTRADEAVLVLLSSFLFRLSPFVFPLAPALWGGDAPAVPERPWLPFPELPAVLYYEDFGSGVGALTGGKIEEVPSGGKALLMGQTALTLTGPNGSVQRQAGVAVVNLLQTKVRVPGGNKPNQMILYLSIWAEETGDLILVFQGKEKHQAHSGVSVAKKWVPLSIPFSELAKLPATETIARVEIIFLPRGSNAYHKAYINEIMITNGVPKAAAVQPLAQRARKQVRDLERTWAQDGFTFQPQNLEVLRKALSSAGGRKKQKSVLVLGPRAADGPDLLTALGAAAPKAKLTGFTFFPAEAPDNSPVGGLEDMRMLLKCNLDKTQAQFALLVLSYKDASGGQNAADSVNVVLERALAAGCIPIVCLPPLLARLGPADKPKVETFVNAVDKACSPKGIVLVEAASTLKDVAEPLNEGELSAAGLQGVAGVSAAALKCLETNLLGHR